jgi:hypothetical protein
MLKLTVLVVLARSIFNILSIICLNPLPFARVTGNSNLNSIIHGAVITGLKMGLKLLHPY